MDRVKGLELRQQPYGDPQVSELTCLPPLNHSSDPNPSRYRWDTKVCQPLVWPGQMVLKAELWCNRDVVFLVASCENIDIMEACLAPNPET